MPKIDFETKARNWIAQLAKDAGSVTKLVYAVRDATGREIAISTMTKWIHGDMTPHTSDMHTLALTSRRMKASTRSKRYAARTGLTAALGL